MRWVSLLRGQEEPLTRVTTLGSARLRGGSQLPSPLRSAARPAPWLPLCAKQADPFWEHKNAWSVIAWLECAKWIWSFLTGLSGEPRVIDRGGAIVGPGDTKCCQDWR